MFYHRREKGLFWQLSNLSSGSIYLFIMEFFLITAESLSSSSFGFQAAQEKTTTNNLKKKKNLNPSFIQACWLKSVRRFMW